MPGPVQNSNIPLFYTTAPNARDQPPKPLLVPKNVRIVKSELTDKLAPLLLEELTQSPLRVQEKASSRLCICCLPEGTDPNHCYHTLHDGSKTCNKVFVGFTVREAIIVLNNLDTLDSLKGEERKAFLGYLLDVDSESDPGRIRAGGGWDLTKTCPTMLNKRDWKKLLDLYQCSVLEAEVSLMLSMQTMKQTTAVRFVVPSAHAVPQQAFRCAATEETHCRPANGETGATVAAKFGNMVWRLVWSPQLHTDMYCRECGPPIDSDDWKPLACGCMRTAVDNVRAANDRAVPYVECSYPGEDLRQEVEKAERAAVAAGCAPHPRPSQVKRHEGGAPAWKYCEKVLKRAKGQNDKLRQSGRGLAETVRIFSRP